MSMNLENKVSRLPDYYDKTEQTSNNWKILEIAARAKQLSKEDCDAVRDSADISTASGKQLDIWGDMLGVKRGEATDEAYRIKLLIKQMQNKIQPDYTSWYSAMLEIFQCPSNELEIQRAEDPMAYRFIKFPYARLNDIGMTVPEATELIRVTAPVTVAFESVEYNTWGIIASFTWQDVASNNHTWQDVLESADFR